MSNFMLKGILGMPMPDNIEDLDFLTYRQFIQAAQQAAIEIDELEKQNDRLQDRYVQMVGGLASNTNEITNLTIIQQKALTLLTSALNNNDIVEVQEAIRTSILILDGERT